MNDLITDERSGCWFFNIRRTTTLMSFLTQSLTLWHHTHNNTFSTNYHMAVFLFPHVSSISLTLTRGEVVLILLRTELDTTHEVKSKRDFERVYKQFRNSEVR